jgi:hypothetical protein
MRYPAAVKSRREGSREHFNIFDGTLLGGAACLRRILRPAVLMEVGSAHAGRLHLEHDLAWPPVGLYCGFATNRSQPPGGDLCPINFQR